MAKQHDLDRNIALLQRLIQEKGEPRVTGVQLYFGDHLVNGNYEIVDKVRDKAGGTATIFLGNLRISTNVRKPEGDRAVGTMLNSSFVL